MCPRVAALLGLALLLPACGGHSGDGGGGGSPTLPAGMVLAGGPNGASIQYLTAVGPLLFFIFDDGIHGAELWRSDGTPQGTFMAKDICPGPVSSRPTNLMAVGSILLFGADDGVHGMSLWRSDGTASGTVMVADLNPGGGNSFVYVGPGTTAVVGNTLFFPGNDGGAHVGLWKSDGTAAGTVFLNSTQPGGGGTGTPFIAAGTSEVFFFGYDPALSTNSLWKSDGTVAGTVHLLDLTNPANLMATGSRAYFSAWDSTHGSQLWTSDGTSAGTALVADLDPVPNGSNPGNFVAAGPLVFFAALTSGGQNLWQTDGTAAGTLAVQPSPTQVAPNWGAQTNGMNALGSELYFKGVDNFAGAELWKTDGTVAGTVRVSSSPNNLNPNGIAPLGAIVFFAGTDAAHGAELWSSDGTAGGTGLVWDIQPGPGSSLPNQLTTVGATLFFTADDGSGVSLWHFPP